MCQFTTPRSVLHFVPVVKIRVSPHLMGIFKFSNFQILKFLTKVI